MAYPLQPSTAQQMLAQYQQALDMQRGLPAMPFQQASFPQAFGLQGGYISNGYRGAPTQQSLRAQQAQQAQGLSQAFGQTSPFSPPMGVPTQESLRALQAQQPQQLQGPMQRALPQFGQMPFGSSAPQTGLSQAFGQTSPFSPPMEAPTQQALQSLQRAQAPAPQAGLGAQFAQMPFGAPTQQASMSQAFGQQGGIMSDGYRGAPTQQGLQAQQGMGMQFAQMPFSSTTLSPQSANSGMTQTSLQQSGPMQAFGQQSPLGSFFGSPTQQGLQAQQGGGPKYAQMPFGSTSLSSQGLGAGASQVSAQQAGPAGLF